MISPESLHDATLVDMRLEWKTGHLCIRLDVRIGERRSAMIGMRGVTEWKCPRLMPWGPSASVNGVQLVEAGGGVVLRIEMQSGDVIEATARDATIA